MSTSVGLPEALERAATALPSDADAIRPANGDPGALLRALDAEAAARVLGWLLQFEPEAGSELAAAWAEEPDAEAGTRLARALVEEKLAACVNLVPGVRSFYRWQGKLEDSG